MELSQLDAEDVILFSSPYRGTLFKPSHAKKARELVVERLMGSGYYCYPTAESKNATKKPHKMRKSVDFSTDFDILIPNTIFFSIILYLSLKVAFVLR